MIPYTFANNINTTLAASLSSTGTTAVVASSTGLPTLAAGSSMPMTLNDAATGLVIEIVYVTAIAGTTLTILRAQEGTTAQTWAIGDNASVDPTAIPGSATSQEIAAVIVAGGLTPTLGNNAQMVTAIESLIGGQAAIPARTKRFTTSGTWTVPAGITTVFASGCAGGAGGNNLASGGAGQPAIKQAITVVPGDVLTVTIGAAGAGGYPAGTGGGNTTIVDTTTSTTLLTLIGATGPTASAISTGYPNGGGLNSSGQAYHAGAGGPFGGGGAAAGPSPATSSTLDAYGYGAGGGQQEGATAGGNGAPGLMILEW